VQTCSNPFVGLNNSYRFTIDTVSIRNEFGSGTNHRVNENTGIVIPTKEVVSTVRNFNLEAGTHTILLAGQAS